MNVLVNFSNEDYKQSRLKLNDSAKRFGIERIMSYDEDSIRSTEFYKKNSEIFLQPKGFGLWLWKPYIIQQALEQSNEDDIIIYSDSGIEIIRELTPLLQICEKMEILLFANGNLRNRYWTKRDCFVLLNLDAARYWNSVQVDAAFCLFKNTNTTKFFVAEWLNYCTDIRIIGDQSNVMGKPNFFGFHRHRHDQSVLSLLALRAEIPVFRQPTQFGNHYKTREFRIPGERNCISQFRSKQVSYYSKKPFENSPYFQLLNHHRENSKQIVKVKQNLIEFVLASGKRRIKKIIKLLTRQ